MADFQAVWDAVGAWDTWARMTVSAALDGAEGAPKLDTLDALIAVEADGFGQTALYLAALAAREVTLARALGIDPAMAVRAGRAALAASVSGGRLGLPTEPAPALTEPCCAPTVPCAGSES